jgi:hypothetical protein
MAPSRANAYTIREDPSVSADPEKKILSMTNIRNTIVHAGPTPSRKTCAIWGEMAFSEEICWSKFCTMKLTAIKKTRPDTAFETTAIKMP